jgi:hypothetical protein
MANTHSAMERKSISHPQAQESAQSQPYITYSNGFHLTALHPCSTATPAPSQDLTSWITSKPSSSKSALTPQTTQVIHCEKERQFQQAGKEYPERKSNCSDDGKVTQSIYTSTKSPNPITKQKF